MKNKNITKFATSLVYVVLGAALIVEPGLVEDLFAYLLAGAAVLLGLIQLVAYLFTNVETRIEKNTNGFAVGISLIILGIFVLMKSTMFIVLIPFALGFMITFKGVEGIQNILNLRKFGYKVQKASLMASLIIIAFGLLVMVNPFSTMKLLLMMLGAGLLVSGLFDIIADIIFTSRMKKGPKNDEQPKAADIAEDIIEDSVEAAEELVEEIPVLQIEE